MLLYEPCDFRDNPSLMEDPEAVDSFIGQVIVRVTKISKELGTLLLIARKEHRFGYQAPAAVYTDHRGNHLIYNLEPILTENYEEDDYVTIFIHEALHLLHMHTVIYVDHQKYKNHKAVNLGLDTTINQEAAIDQKVLEKTGAVTLKGMEEALQAQGFTGQLKAKQTSPYYISIIEKYMKEQSGGGNGHGQNGDNDGDPTNHGEWAKNGSSAEDQIRGLANQLKTAPIDGSDLDQLVRNMSDDLEQAGFDTLSGYFREVMNSGYVKSLPTFKSVMSRLMRLDKQHVRTIRAYRHEDGTNIIKKGRKQRPDSASLIYFYGDTSGSINFQDVENTISTLNRQKQTYDAKLYLFSDEVYDFNPEKVYVGGTDIQAVFDHANKHIENKNTQIVILTDGYFASNANTHGFTKIHFVLTEYHTTDALPEGSKYTVISDAGIKK